MIGPYDVELAATHNLGDWTFSHFDDGWQSMWTRNGMMS